MKLPGSLVMVAVLVIVALAIHFSPRQSDTPKTVIAGDGEGNSQFVQERSNASSGAAPKREYAQQRSEQQPQQQLLHEPSEKVHATHNPDPQPVVVQVTLRGFVPDDLTIPVGTTVVWNETVDRPVAIEDYKGHFRAKFGLGQNFTYRFDTEGEYLYRDLIINWRGKVIVTSKDFSTTG